MIRIIAMAVLALVAGVLALAASRPDSFRVQRSASSFGATRAAVYADFEAGLANLKALAEK